MTIFQDTPFCQITAVLWLKIGDLGQHGRFFRFCYFLKEQFFLYIVLKFGSIKRHIYMYWRLLFARPIFFRSDVSCNHSIGPFISLQPWLSCLRWTLKTFERTKLVHWKLQVVMNRMHLNFRIYVIWWSLHNHGLFLWSFRSSYCPSSLHNRVLHWCACIDALE